MFKQKNGITLVALIITVIVLLVLTGVVINLSMGENGIIGKAQKTVGKYENAVEEEKYDLAKMSNVINNYVDGNRNVSEDRIREIINETLSNKSFSIYPEGTPVLLDSSEGVIELKTTTAPDDGWIIIFAGANGHNGVYYTLSVGDLSESGGDSATWQSYGTSFPCKKGLKISYRWWGQSCYRGSLTFIPQKSSE